jgi:hypothetical protein
MIVDKTEANKRIPGGQEDFETECKDNFIFNAAKQNLDPASLT